MKINYILVLLLGTMLIGLVGAEINEYAPVKQGDCVTIKQTCGTCTYVNVTIALPNSTLQVSNKEMSEVGGGAWTYEFCNTTVQGRYDVMGSGDLEGTETSFDVLYFNVTPSGRFGNIETIIYLFIAIMLYGIGFIGFFGKNEWISALGGMAMMAFGIYTISEGMIVFRDWVTNYFAYVTIGLGAIFALVAIVESIQDSM